MTTENKTNDMERLFLLLYYYRRNLVNRPQSFASVRAGMDQDPTTDPMLEQLGDLDGIMGDSQYIAHSDILLNQLFLLGVYERYKDDQESLAGWIQREDERQASLLEEIRNVKG